MGDKVLFLGEYSLFLSDKLCEYDIQNDKWNELKIRLPDGMCAFRCTSVINQQYILLFGALTMGMRQNKDLDDIWIYSFGDKTFHRSNIKYPMRGYLKAFTINDKENDEMMVFGYMRNEWKLSDLAGHLFPPRYLIKMIQTYFLNEYVHLTHLPTGLHWKCDVFEIVHA